MNTSKLLKLFLCVFILSALLTGTGFAKDVESLAIELDGADVSGKSVYLNYSDSYTFDVTVDPSDADVDLSVTSSNLKLAEASISGTAVTVDTYSKRGSVQITVRDKNTKKSVSVRVYVQQLSTSILVDGPDEVYSSMIGKMTASVFPTDATNKYVVWYVKENSCSSTDEEDVKKCDPTDAAVINSSGVLTGKKVDSPTDIAVIACPKDGGADCETKTVTVKPVTITLAGDETEVKSGSTLKISAAFDPADLKSKQLQWKVYKDDGSCSLSDLESCEVSSAAVVNSAGTVTAKKVETDEDVLAVACLSSDKTVCDSYAFTVLYVEEIKSIRLKYNGEDCTGDTIYLSCEVTDTVEIECDPTGAGDLTVTGSNNKVADVSESGGTITVETKTLRGSTRITVRDSVTRKSVYVNVMVQQLTETVAVSGDSTVYSGSTIKMTADVGPSNASNKNVKWYVYDDDGACGPMDLSSCSPTEAASIASTGVLTGKEVTDKSGVDVIVIACPVDGGASCDSTTVTVMPVTFTLDGETEVYSGASIVIKPDFTPANPKSKQLQWKIYEDGCDVDDLTTCVVSDAATVNSGTVTGKDVSTDTSVAVVACLAKNKAICASHTITVKPAAKSIVIYNDDTGEKLDSTVPVMIEEGDTINLSADATPDEGTYKWTTSSKSIATVDGSGSTTGNPVTVEGLKKGITVITAASNNGKVKKTVKIQVLGKQVESITIEAPSTELVDGGSMQLKAKVLPANADKKNVKWSLCKDSSECPYMYHATISASGKLSVDAVSARTEITVYAEATDGSGVEDKITITLIPKAKAMFIVDEDILVTVPFWGEPGHYHSKDLTDRTAPIVKDLNYIDKKYVQL
ncbi:MAG: Ig-like domain-containing protein, partial [Anaerolineaceae bacterium]|nr:Ig-like domain-containing protein [Anaerolineaceae bacterium]